MSHDSRVTSPAHGSAAIGAHDPRPAGAPDPNVTTGPTSTPTDPSGAPGAIDASSDRREQAGAPDGSAAGPRGAGVDGAATDEPASPVIAARFSIQGFIDGWIHCQHVADYLARFAASDRFDPEQLTTRLSTYLNEALELVFRCRPPDGPGAGELVITIDRRSDRLQIELRCPLAEGGDRLRRSVERATGPDAAAAYRRGFASLLGADVDDTDAGADEDAGLLELVALHGITLALREPRAPDADAADAVDADAAGTVVLCMTVPHE